MPHPNRTWTAADGNYRYGFNGVEKEGEVYGKGHLSSMDFRMYDPRVGRWWGVDKIVKVHESPYAAFFNSPINYADPSGLHGGKMKTQPATDGGCTDCENLPSGSKTGKTPPTSGSTTGGTNMNQSTGTVFDNSNFFQDMQSIMNRNREFTAQVRATWEKQRREQNARPVQPTTLEFPDRGNSATIDANQGNSEGAMYQPMWSAIGPYKTTTLDIPADLLKSYLTQVYANEFGRGDKAAWERMDRELRLMGIRGADNAREMGILRTRAARLGSLINDLEWAAKGGFIVSVTIDLMDLFLGGPTTTARTMTFGAKVIIGGAMMFLPGPWWVGLFAALAVEFIVNPTIEQKMQQWFPEVPKKKNLLQRLYPWAPEPDATSTGTRYERVR